MTQARKKLDHESVTQFRKHNSVKVASKQMWVNTANAILKPRFLGSEYRIELCIIFKNYDILSNKARLRARREYLEMSEELKEMLKKYKFKVPSEAKVSR